MNRAISNRDSSINHRHLPVDGTVAIGMIAISSVDLLVQGSVS
jgi:hypothetical protein